MAKTLSQLAADVLDELGEDSADATLLAQAQKWVQRIYDDIGDELDWRFNYVSDDITTVATQATYDMDIDARDISSCRMSDTGEIIEYRSKDFLYANGYDMEATASVPLYFYFDTFNNTTGTQKIGFWPIPSTSSLTIQLNCTGRPTTLVAGTNIPVPHEFLGLIHEGALALGHRHEREWDSFDRTYNFYLNHKRNLIRAYKFPRGGRFVLHNTDVPSRSGQGPVRLPPGRFRNWW